jgi:hypothetical protein
LFPEVVSDAMLTRLLSTGPPVDFAANRTADP